MRHGKYYMKRKRQRKKMRAQILKRINLSINKLCDNIGKLDRAADIARKETIKAFSILGKVINHAD